MMCHLCTRTPPRRQPYEWPAVGGRYDINAKVRGAGAWPAGGDGFLNA